MPVDTKATHQAAIRFWKENWLWLKKRVKKRGDLSRQVNLLLHDLRKTEEDGKKKR